MMAQAKRDGGSDPLGIGERQEKARRTRKAWIIGAALAIGFSVGLYAGYHEGEGIFLAASGWPPAMAIGIALAYVLVVVAGGVALSPHTDEVEMQRQYKAVAAAALVYVLAYPVWFVLWMGGLVPEPMHDVLFLLFWIGLGGASLFYRFR